jgi:hypothetical protein
MDYSLGLAVRIARCLHQDFKLKYSSRVIRPEMLGTPLPPARTQLLFFLRVCAVHESLHGPEPPSLRQTRDEKRARFAL